MAIGPIKAPVSGASSFQSLILADKAGVPQQRVVIELASAAEIPSREETLQKLAKLESGQSVDSKARKFSFNFEDFLNLK